MQRGEHPQYTKHQFSIESLEKLEKGDAVLRDAAERSYPYSVIVRYRVVIVLLSATVLMLVIMMLLMAGK